VSSGVEQTARRLERRLGGPPRLVFPEDWYMSTSWQRAQLEDDHGGPLNPAERHVLLDDSATAHRVLFAIKNGEIIAECDCQGWSYRNWCAHVASCWWRWARGEISVVDLNTERTHVYPPAWLTIEDREVDR